jgi:hypothetical protein
MAVINPENLYSFRAVTAIIDITQPDTAALAAIEAKLVEANNDYLNGQYQNAIEAYQAAASLIYSHLDPTYPSGVVFPGIVFPTNPKLFDPLLSVGIEWTNVLPVKQPFSSVRPRVPVDPELLLNGVTHTGVASAVLSTPAQLNALADWQLAKTYSGQSNLPQSRFFFQQATKTDPDTVKALGSVDGPAGTGQQTGRDLAGGSSETTVQPAAVARAAVSGAATLVADEPLPRPALPPVLTTGTRTLGLQSSIVIWDAGQAPSLEIVKTSKYVGRISAKDLGLLAGPSDASGVALDLPHDYYYVIPLGLAECYHALGDFGTAETKYFMAAQYQFLNQAIEAPYLFQRLATLYLDWGNSLYRTADDNPGGAGDAATVYQNVLKFDGTAPASNLYTTTALKPGADQAQVIIANLNNLIGKSLGQTVVVPDVNPTLSGIILEVHQQLLKIQGGLDFWGHATNTVPIWSFEYLQNAAINFAQLAMNAEKDFISFQERADQGTLTRQQLQQGITQANAEVDAAQAQVDAAQAEQTAYQDGVTLANQRATDAARNVIDYGSTSEMSIVYQAASQQLSGGDDGDPNQLNSIADALQGIGDAGQRLREGWHLEGSAATLAAGNQLAASRYTRQYEIAAMQREANQLKLAANQAVDEAKAAQARTAAAQAGKAVAVAHQQAAAQSLAAFDNQFFTPDVWYRLADASYRLYRRYLYMAIRTARLMQRAYNFETDQTLRWIKADYSTGEVKGLLGAEALMADIQSFSFDLITSRATKPQAVKQMISLYNQYGFAFENQLRKTGVMEFQTRLEDFDLYYPGTYSGRIEGVEVNIIGVLPPTGISGTLTNSGVSTYRTPAPAAGDATGIKFRVQSKETLVLSDYSVRQDALLVSSDSGMLKIMQGAGLASTWRLELPRAINDIDYGALTDVQLTLYYKTRYDPVLHDAVLTQLAMLPGINTRQRGIPLRWIYPDAYFHFQDTGTLSITLKKSDFRTNETNPQLTSVGALVVTDGSVPAKGITVSLATPAHAAITAVTDQAGQINSEGASPWVPLASGAMLGGYTLAVTAAANPELVKNGRLDLSPLVNIALLLQYSFTPRT